MQTVHFTTGSADHTDDVIALFDANIVWLCERGRSAQWGSDPWSRDPKKIEFVRGLLSSGVVTIAEMDGDIVGASIVTDHPMPYVPASDEVEQYLKLLIVSPSCRGQGIGHDLITKAREHTVHSGVGLLRVDCWSGGDRRLVTYYISEGFTPTQEIEVRPGTSVQVFEWRAAT